MGDKLSKLKFAGDKLYKNKKWKMAIDTYTEAIELDNTNYSLFSNRSACYAALNDFENSLKDAAKVIDIVPNFSKGYSRKAHALLNLGRTEEALLTCRQGLKICPSDPLLLKKYNIITENSTKGMLPSHSITLGCMDSEIDNWYKNDLEFKNKINKLVDTYPTSEELQEILSDHKMMKFLQYVGIFGNSQNKNNDFSTNLNKNIVKKVSSEKESEDNTKRNESENWKIKGTENYKNNKFEEALRCYEEAENIFPKDPTYILNQSAVYMMQNKLNLCEEKCKKSHKNSTR
jgi:stress-induced-phosphoprotein 1